MAMMDDPGGDRSEFDTMYHILSVWRRRAILRVLDEEPSLCLSELADRIARCEHGREPTREERQRVYISVYQHHLPKMADAGIIEYQRDRGRIQRLAKANRYIRFLPERSSISRFVRSIIGNGGNV